MIELRHLRYFVALGELQHFTRAAERLHLTQPALSRQIAALEMELGVALIDRHARRAQLTQAGKHFLLDAQAILLSVDQACRDARAVASGEAGELKIGFMMHAAYSSVSALTRQLLKDQPKLRLQLRETMPPLLLAGVREGQFDAGIGFNPGVVHGVSTELLYQEHLCLAVPASHPLVARSLVSREDLVNQPMIMSPADVTPALRQAIITYLAPTGVAPLVRLKTQLQQTIVSLVAENIGIALVPQSLNKLMMPGTVFRPLVDSPTVEQVLFWRSNNSNPALPKLLAAARKTASALIDTKR